MRQIADLRMETDLHDPQILRLLNRRPAEGDRATITGRLEPGNHRVTIVVQHRGGTYKVARVTVDAPENGEITSAVLGIAVKESADEMLAKAWALFGATSEFESRGQDFKRGQRRRSMDDTFLRRVAEVYTAAESAGAESVISAVADELGPAGYSTGQRWVREARRRGFLPAASGTDGRRPR